MIRIKQVLLLQLIFLSIVTVIANASEDATIEPGINITSTIGGNKSALLHMAINQPHLGMGFSSSTNNLTNIQCVSGSEVEFGPVKESVRLLANESLETIRDELFGRLDAGISLGGVSLDAGGLVDRRTVSGDYASTYSFIYQGVSRRRVLLPYDPENPLIDSHYDTSGCASIFASSNAPNIVGDEFVNSILLGGLLKFDLTMTAHNKSDIDVLKGHLKMGSSNGFHLDIAGAEEQGVNLNEVRITLSLSQQGGRPEMLQQAVGDSAVSCRASNWSACTELYTTAINYAFNSFPSQFDNGGDEFILSYTTVPYRNARIADFESLNGADEIKQLAVLLHLRGEYDQALTYLNELVVLEANQSEIVAAESEVTSLESQYRLCQQDHEYCSSIVIN